MHKPSDTTRFVIITVPRSGSNWLCTLLNSHDEILCHHEIFNPEEIHYAIDKRNGIFDFGTVEERNHHPELFIRKTWQQTLGYAFVGFKVNRGQDPRVFTNILDDTDVKKIVLSRNNRIKTFLSEAIAEQTLEWESYPWKKLRTEQTTIHVDIERLHEHIQQNQNFYTDIRKTLHDTRQHYIDVRYEDIARITERQRILHYLGVNDVNMSLVESTRKQNTSDLRNMISNFDEVAHHLKGSELEQELYT